MITVTIWRKTLVRLGACDGGLALFDAIASQQPDDPRRLKRIRVQWGDLACVWLCAGAPSFAGWLRDRKLVPIADLRGANLRGANLCGADRYFDDHPIPGWRVEGGVLAADKKDGAR